MAWFIGGLLVVVVVIVVVVVTPTRVQYAEETIIGAPVARVYDNIRYQHHLMQWSAWPTETKSTCSVEHADGVVGARTVFFSKGKRFGHQEVIALEENRLVALTLQSAGPPQKPELRFVLEPLGAERTKVRLEFTNDLPRPFNLLLRLFGMVRWTRSMHVKDLAGLQKYSEPPHLSYAGEPMVALA